MGRASIWNSIAETLRADILDGCYRPGEKLPTETELARRFGVNRHTLRRAVAALAAEGLLRSQRGSGVYVRPRPVTLPICGGLDLPVQLADSARLPLRRSLRLLRRPAAEAEAEAFDCRTGLELLFWETLLELDGHPVCLCHDLLREDRVPGIAQQLAATVPSPPVPMRELLGACGLSHPEMRSVRVCVDPPDAAMAERLGQAEPGPVLHSVALVEDGAGIAVNLREYWVDAERACLSFSPGRRRGTGPRLPVGCCS